MSAELTPIDTRAQDAALVTHCSLSGLQDHLPLMWYAPPDTPPCPKKDYRSHYTYQGWQDLLDPLVYEHLSDFDLLLRLVDFSPLRPLLSHLLGWTSARGWKPFDPLSMFLLIGWQITHGWSRAETLLNLRHPRFADYARRFGFQDGHYPTEGGLRYWLTALGQHSTSDQKVLVDEEQHIEIAIQRLNHLLAQSATLLVQHGFVSPAAWNQALICPDGMIHDAASRLRCTSVQETCYQPTSSDAPRPCPARQKDRQGCTCDTTVCASVCRHATPRDPCARFIWYTGSNQRPDNPNRPTQPDQAHHPHGQARYGYRSLPLLLADPARRFSLILLDDFLPANQREELPFAAHLLQLSTFYPNLHVDAVAGDAAFGYDVVLRVVYRHLHARRVIDLRAHESDGNKALWPIRGYNDRGRPICPYGYALTANGFDFDRQRHKWACFHACRQDTTPAVCLPTATYPPDECPHLKLPCGQLINVAECFQQDGSLRLVRDVPVGTPTWKRLYHRARNASEGRNSAFERWHIKQLHVYGDPRGRALIFQADVWVNLTTMARLVREATAATGVT